MLGAVAKFDSCPNRNVSIGTVCHGRGAAGIPRVCIETAGGTKAEPRTWVRGTWGALVLAFLPLWYPPGSLFVVVPAQNFRGSWILNSSTGSGISEGLES